MCGLQQIFLTSSLRNTFFLIFTMESIILAYINQLIVIYRLTSVLEIKQTKSLKFQQNEVKQKRRVVYCWSGGSSKSLQNVCRKSLKNNFQLVDKNIEGTQTRSCTLFYPLCVCIVATGKHSDWVSQNSERIFILIKLNNNTRMMLYWFIMLRKIYQHLVGIKNYEFTFI